MSTAQGTFVRKIRGLRWYIAGLLCLATALNYLDRQTLALLAQTLEQSLGITTIKYSYIVTAFLTSYTIMYAVSGRLIDRLGTRRGFGIFVSLWSVGDLLHALARTALQFSFCRVLLGAAEPANFPAATKAVSEWFPMRERAMAVGVFQAGTAIGACAAAPLTAWITLHWGWRYTFVVGAGLSAAWVVLWLLTYRLPRQHPRLSAEELRHIEEGSPPPVERTAVPLRRILGIREVWGCILVRMLMDPVSYFCIFWMPKFLQQERGFDLAAIGRYYWMPYVAAAFGNLVGGVAPRTLCRQGWSINRSRKTVMFSAASLFLACFVLTTRVPNPAITLGLISVAFFCHQVFCFMALPAEALPENVVGAVTGFGGALGSLAGAVSMLVIGRIVSVSLFMPIFVVYSILPLTAFAVVCVLIRNLGRVREIPA
jgi:ACS family hexuronate transporter-like MFS transporter